MLLVAIAFPTGVIAISGACELPRGCIVDFDFKFGGSSNNGNKNNSARRGSCKGKRKWLSRAVKNVWQERIYSRCRRTRPLGTRPLPLPNVIAL